MRCSLVRARTLRAAPVLMLTALSLALPGSALAVSSFTETFDTNDANWLDGDSGVPTYSATGGVGNSGYISWNPVPDFNSGPGGFGDPLKITFRGNGSNNASGGAFVGDWLSSGVTEISLAIRHNNASPLNLYARLNSGFGAAASIGNGLASTLIAPNTWTTITIPITDTNPPFVSYGAGTFNSVFSNMNDLQFGLYLPANTEFSGLVVDLDNVSIVAVPEPGTLGLMSLGLLGLVLGRRSRS